MGLLSKVIAMTDELTEEVLVDKDAAKLPQTHALADAESIVKEYFDASGSFNCCVFHTSLQEESPDHILESIESFGRLIVLQENTFMLLFPSSIDHELLLYHLDKRFHLNIIEQFSADAPQKVLECIHNYL
jgi:hypothetical protein